MRNINTDKLIADYLAGNINPEDLAQLNRHYGSESKWKEFKRRIPAWRRRTPMAWKALSATVALALVVLLSYRQGSKDVRDQFADVVIEIPNGSKMNVSLPDGSTVLLNGGSHLCYSQGFGITDRNISFNGEGFFEVAHNENLPMHIASENLSVEVLGTKFAYKDYSGENDAYVALTQGSVKISSDEENLILKPGQSAVLNAESGLFKVSDNRNSDLLVWKNGGFNFEEETLESITRQLSRAYELTFIFDSEELKSLRFYAYFAPDDSSAESILSRLSATGAFKYEINRKNVTIKR